MPPQAGTWGKVARKGVARGPHTLTFRRQDFGDGANLKTALQLVVVVPTTDRPKVVFQNTPSTAL